MTELMFLLAALAACTAIAVALLAWTAVEVRRLRTTITQGGRQVQLWAPAPPLPIRHTPPGRRGITP